MNLGAEPKKIAAAAILFPLAGYLVYSNLLSSPDPGPAPSRPKAAVAAPPPAQPAIRRTRGRELSEEFRPSLKLKPEDRPDPTKIDPTLRLDLLAKVQSVEPKAGARSIFQFGSAPAPVAQIPKVGPIKPKTPEQIKAEQQAAAQAAKPGEAPPPPITLKFYGYATPRTDGVKRAFFLDGEDIFVASEGELVKRRYKVVRIGVNSVVMEDTQFKNNRQTIILQQEQAG
jgi:hypothetical protein